MVQNTMRASFGSFSGGRATMAEYLARSLGIMGRDMERPPYVVPSPFAGTYPSFRRLRQQRLAGANAGEDHRLGRDLEAILHGADDGVARVSKLRGVREVLAVVRAATVGAGLRGGADRPADQHQIFQIEPVHPGQVVALLGVGDAHHGNRGGEVVQLMAGGGSAAP